MLTTTTNCNVASLAAYNPSTAKPWNRQRAQHVFRRLGFSEQYNSITAALGQSPTALIDSLIDEAIAMPPTAAPEWATWNNTFYPEDSDLKQQQYEEFKLTYTNALLTNNLRERLSFFWHNHFVTELREYDCPSYLYQYFNMLQVYALGNFKDFVHAVGINPAMLAYLNGLQNGKWRPNENYARELYELFTMGEGNGYTEEDIMETARALTGYTNRDEGCGEILFNPDTHDADAKTIFGQTGAWGYDDVIDILFAQRPNEIATFICGKLYEFFVNPQQVPEITQELAQTFISNNFEIAPVLRQLLKSEHFFDDEAIGVVIKSHFDVALNFIKETGFPYDDDTLSWLTYVCEIMGQELFNPVDVAGWQRNRWWINANSIIGRWRMLEVYLESVWQMNPEAFRTFAINIAGGANNNPYDVCRQLCDWFLPKGFTTPEDYTIAEDIFVADIPDTYIEQNLWNLYWDQANMQVLQLLLHIIKQPEFQLK